MSDEYVTIKKSTLIEVAEYLGATHKNDWSGLRPDDAMSGKYRARVGALMEIRDAAFGKEKRVTGGE